MATQVQVPKNAAGTAEASHDIAKLLSDALPDRRNPYEKGFRDALESMVLALHGSGLNEQALQDAVMTALDAYTNHVEEADALATESGRVSAPAEDPQPVTSLSHHSVLACLNGDALLRALAGDKEAIPGISLEKEFAESLGAPLAIELYYVALARAANRLGYDRWVTASPGLASITSARSTPVAIDPAAVTPSLVQQSLGSFFDSLVDRDWLPDSVVWFARGVEQDSSPRAHEWGIHAELRGIGLPEHLVAHELTQARTRQPLQQQRPLAAEILDVEPDDTAPAPGQGA